MKWPVFFAGVGCLLFGVMLFPLGDSGWLPRVPRGTYGRRLNLFRRSEHFSLTH